MQRIQMTECKKCGEQYDPRRRALGWQTCLSCGESDARQVVHTIAPMHKSNYIHVGNLEDLKGLNNKGGFYNDR